MKVMPIFRLALTFASVGFIGLWFAEDEGAPEPVHTFGWYNAKYNADAKERGAAVIIWWPVPHKDGLEKTRNFAKTARRGQEVAAQPTVRCTMT